MPLEKKGRGIIVRIHPRSETSLLVRWLTEEFGIIATLAKGARGPKSPFRGKLDLFFESEFALVQRSANSLGFLRECATVDDNPHLRASLPALALASQAALLVDRNAERDTPVPGLFGLLRDYLAALGPPEPAASFILPFNWKFLHAMGLAPAPAMLAMDPGCKSIVAFYLENSFHAARAIQPAPRQARDLLSAFARLIDDAGLALPPARRPTGRAPDLRS